MMMTTRMTRPPSLLRQQPPPPPPQQSPSFPPLPRHLHHRRHQHPTSCSNHHCRPHCRPLLPLLPPLPSPHCPRRLHFRRLLPPLLLFLRPPHFRRRPRPHRTIRHCPHCPYCP